MRIFAAFSLLVAFPLGAATIDRIAAIVDRQVLTVSEISQMVEIHFFPRTTGWSEDDYRKNILDSLIAQALRFRDVERFGGEDVSKDSIEARLLQIQQRFASPAEFTSALQRAELTLDEVEVTGKVVLVGRLVPVEQRVVDKETNVMLAASRGKLPQDVSLRPDAVRRRFTAPECIAVVMLGGQRDVPRAGVFGERGPFAHGGWIRRERGGRGVARRFGPHRVQPRLVVPRIVKRRGPEVDEEPERRAAEPFTRGVSKVFSG